MKKAILAVVIILLWTSTVYGQGWETFKKPFFQWDAPDYVKEYDLDYVLYLVDERRDPYRLNPIQIARIKSTSFKYTPTVEGTFLFGVTTIRLDDGAQQECWSDIPSCMQNGRVFKLKVQKHHIHGTRWKIDWR